MSILVVDKSLAASIPISTRRNSREKTSFRRISVGIHTRSLDPKNRHLNSERPPTTTSNLSVSHSVSRVDPHLHTMKPTGKDFFLTYLGRYSHPKTPTPQHTNTHPPPLFQICPFHVRLVAATLRTEPLPLRLARQSDAVEVEPFDRARVVVAANHLAVRDQLTQAVGRLVGVDRRVDGRLVLRLMFLLVRLTLLLFLRPLLFLLRIKL